MEDWEKKIILQNMDKLVETTQCSSVLLAKLLAHGILSVNDAEELNSMKGNSTEQALELYNILLTRQHGFKTLLQALDKTKQTGALSILTKETTTEYMISFTYDVKSVIGGHNESIVYKGRFGNRDVAVKKLLLKVIDAETVSHEIEILKNCDAHQNIVRYFGSKKTPSSILILLELCDTNLSEWVKHKSVDILPMEVLRQATLGLEWLHSKRIVHRSLKPENVLLSRNASQVKISDFVLSKSILGETSYESSSLKFGWNAPETFSQLVDQKHRKPDFTFASDVFSLGCMYYYVITDGKHPFGYIFSRQSNILEEKMLIDLKQALHCCVQNTLFIRLMLSKDPNSRPSCSQLLASPLFWSDDRRIQFLERVFKSKQISIQMRTFLHSKWNAECAIDHSKEIKLLRKLGAKKEYKLGCVVPVIYLQLIDYTVDFEQFFSSPHGFDTSEVLKLMNNDGKQLFENVRGFEDGSGARKFTRYLSTTFQKLKKAVVEKVGDGGLSDIEVEDNGLSNKTEVVDKPALEYAAEEPTGISNYASTSYETDDQWSQIEPVIIVESLGLMDDDISVKLVSNTDSSASSSKQKSNVQLEIVKAIVAEKENRIIVQNEQSIIAEKQNDTHIKEGPAINLDNKWAKNAENIISNNSAESSNDIPAKMSETPIYETETKTNLKVAQPEETINLIEEIEYQRDETEPQEDETEQPFESAKASIQLQMTSNENLDDHAMLEFWNSTDKILIICTVAPIVTQNRITETWGMPLLELKTGKQFVPDHSMNHEELTVAHVEDPEKFLQNCRKDKGKFVLLTKVSYTFLVQKLGDQTDLKILKDVINWTDLSATSKEELLTSCSLLRHVDAVTIQKVLNKLNNDIIFQLLEDPCTQLFKSSVPAQIACYIPRKIVRRDTQSENLLLYQNEHTEEEFLRTLGKHTSDQVRLPVYISGTAGTGKSIFLGCIGRRLLNVNKIVIFLTVREFMAYMKTIDKTSHSSHVVVESLCEMASCNTTGKFILAKLFECMCPIELMFDGLDEISSADLKIFYDCLRVLTKTYIVRLWVTTRSHLLHDIKNQLDGIVYMLSPFDLHDQRNLLTAVWQQGLINVSYDENKLRSFSNTCLSELVTALRSDKNSMSCIPFFCYHIAKFYQKEAISYVTVQTKNISALRENYESIANLFEYILSAIFAIYFERYNLSESEIKIECVLSSHAIKSLALLFPEWVPRLKIYFEHNEILEDSEIYRIGILEPDCSNSVPQFIFAGLAEYFIAYFTTTLLVKDSCSKTSVQFLIHEILKTQVFHCEIFGRHSDYYHTKVAARFSHKSICYFLDNIISTDFQIKNLVEVLGTKKNLISQLSLVCVYHDCFRLFQILSKTNAFWFYQSKILDDNFLFVLVRFGRLPFIDFVLEKFEDVSEIHPHTIEISDDPVYLNLLHVAAYRGDYQIFNLLLKQYKFEDYVSKSKHTVLTHICAGYSDCDNDVIIDDKLQIIREIYKLRNDTLEERDHDYRTVILCKNVHIRILKECLKLKANISALDKHGNSFLHTACDYITSLMHYDVAQEIPKSVIRKLVWKRNKFGLSPLHLIVERTQLEVKNRS